MKLLILMLKVDYRGKKNNDTALNVRELLCIIIVTSYTDYLYIHTSQIVHSGSQSFIHYEINKFFTRIK